MPRTGRRRSTRHGGGLGLSKSPPSPQHAFRPDSITAETLHDYVHGVPPPVRPFEPRPPPRVGGGVLLVDTSATPKPPPVSRCGNSSPSTKVTPIAGSPTTTSLSLRGEGSNAFGGAALADSNDDNEGDVSNTLSALSPRAFYYKRFDPDLARESVAQQEAFLAEQREIEQHRAAAGTGRILSSHNMGGLSNTNILLDGAPSSPLSSSMSMANSSVHSMSFRGIPLPPGGCDNNNNDTSTSLLFDRSSSKRTTQMRPVADFTSTSSSSPMMTRAQNALPTTSESPHRAHLAVPVRDVATADTTHMLHCLEDHDQWEYHCLAQNEGLTGDYEDSLVGGLLATVTASRKRDNGGSRAASDRLLANASLPQLLDRHHRSPQTARAMRQGQPSTSTLPRPGSSSSGGRHQAMPRLLGAPVHGGRDANGVDGEPSTPRRNILVKRVELRPKQPEVLEALQQAERAANSTILSQAHARGTLSTYGTSPYLWSPSRPLGSTTATAHPSSSSSPPYLGPVPSLGATTTGSTSSQGAFPVCSEITVSHFEDAAPAVDEDSLSPEVVMASPPLPTSSFPHRGVDGSVGDDEFMANIQRTATLLADGDKGGVQQALEAIEHRRRLAHDAINTRNESYSNSFASGVRSESTATLEPSAGSNRRLSGAVGGGVGTAAGQPNANSRSGSPPVSSSRRGSGLSLNSPSSPSLWPKRVSPTSTSHDTQYARPSSDGLPPLPDQSPVRRPLSSSTMSSHTTPRDHHLLSSFKAQQSDVDPTMRVVMGDEERQHPQEVLSKSAVMLGRFNAAVSTLTARRQSLEDKQLRVVEAATSHLDRIEVLAPELVVSSHLHELIRDRTREAMRVRSDVAPSIIHGTDDEPSTPRDAPTGNVKQHQQPNTNNNNNSANTGNDTFTLSSPKRKKKKKAQLVGTARSDSPNIDPLSATQKDMSPMLQGVSFFELDSALTVPNSGAQQLVPPRRYGMHARGDSGSRSPTSPSVRRKGPGKRVSMRSTFNGDDDDGGSPDTPKTPHGSSSKASSSPVSVRIQGKELLRLQKTVPDWTTLPTMTMSLIFELVRGVRVLQRTFRVYRAKKKVAELKSAVEWSITNESRRLDAQLRIACVWRQFSARLRFGNVRIRAQYLIEQRVELERQGSYAAGLMLQGVDNNIRPRPHGPLSPAPPDFLVSASSMGSLRNPRRNNQNQNNNRVVAGGGGVTRVESYFPDSSSSIIMSNKNRVGTSSPSYHKHQQQMSPLGDTFGGGHVSSSPESTTGNVSSSLRFEMPFSTKDPRYGVLNRLQMRIAQRLIAKTWRSYREYEAVEAQLEAELYLDHLLGRTPFPLVGGSRSAIVGEGAAGLVTHTLQEAMEKRERRLARVARDAHRLHLAGPNRGRRHQDGAGYPTDTSRSIHGAGSTVVSRRQSSIRAMSSSGSGIGMYTMGSDAGSDEYDVPSDADSVDVEIAKLAHTGYETTYVYRPIVGSDDWVLVPVAVPTSGALGRPWTAGSEKRNPSSLMSLVGRSPTASSMGQNMLPHLGGGGPTPPRRFSSRAVLSWDSQPGSSPRGVDTDIGGHLSSEDHAIDFTDDRDVLAAHGRLVVKAPKLKALVKVDVRALKEQAEEDRRRDEAYRLAELQRHRELEMDKRRELEKRAQQAVVMQKVGRGYLRRIDLVAVFIAKLSADLTYGHLLSELTSQDPTTATSMGFSVSAAMTTRQGNLSTIAAVSSSGNTEGPDGSINNASSSPHSPPGGLAQHWLSSLKRGVVGMDGSNTGPHQGAAAGTLMATLQANPHLQVSTLVRMGHQQDAALPTRACFEITRDIFERNPSLFPEAELQAKRRKGEALLIVQACVRWKIDQYYAHAMKRYEAARYIQETWRSYKKQ